MEESVQINNFSNSFFSRLWKLLKLEFVCSGKRALLAVFITVGAIVLCSELIYILHDEGAPLLYDHSFSFVLCSFVFYMLYGYSINKRINKPVPMAYPLIPVGNGVKFVFIFIVYLIYCVLAYVASQLSYTIEWLVNGCNVVSTSKILPYVNGVEDAGTSYVLYNPFIYNTNNFIPKEAIWLIRGFVGYAMMGFAFYQFCCIKFKKFSVALLVYVLASSFISQIAAVVLMLLIQVNPDIIKMVEAKSFALVPYVLSVLIFWATYYSMRRKQI